MIAKLRVGCRFAGCTPGVRTIFSRVWFHCTTASVDPTAESGYEAALYRKNAAHTSASEPLGLSIDISFDCVFGSRDSRSSAASAADLSRYCGDFGTEGFIPSAVQRPIYDPPPPSAFHVRARGIQRGRSEGQPRGLRLAA